MPMMQFVAPPPQKKQKVERNAMFNKQRMQKALESEQFELPKGLTREQKREFILSKV